MVTYRKKGNPSGRTRIYEYTPPPPIIGLATALTNTVCCENAPSKISNNFDLAVFTRLPDVVAKESGYGPRLYERTNSISTLRFFAKSNHPGK